MLKNYLQQKSQTPYLFYVFTAICLVMLVFPDVIFLGTTFNMTGLFTGGQYNLELIKFFPEPVHRGWHHGFNDAGGALFQSEPMIQFIKNALYHLESPYWNPYSAAGSFGPETLVDLKFSFLTVLVAMLGGSALAYDITVLFLNGLAVYFLFILLNQHFKLSILACVAACVLYLLNGYNVANLNSNVAQSYLYFPMALFALCSFAKTPTVMRFLFLIFSNIIIFSCTFFPTTSLILMSIYLVAAGYTLSLYRPHYKSIITLIFLQGASALLAFLSLSLIYFPIIESFSFLDVLNMYSERIFYAAKWPGILSFFTPKAFFDSYNAIDAFIHTWYLNHPNGGDELHIKNLSLVGNSIFHFGIIPSLVAAGAITKWKSHRGIIVGVLLFILLLSLGRIFRTPGIYNAVDYIYGLRSLGEQYWWTWPAVVMPLLAGFGIDAFREKRTRWWPIILIYTVIIGCSIYLYNVFGLIEPYRKYRVFSVCLLGIILLVSFYFIKKIKKADSKAKLTVLSVALIALIFCELNYYSHHMRFVRNDIFKKPVEEILFLKKNAGFHRVATFGWYGLTAEHGAAYQIQQIESMNMNIIPSYIQYFMRNFLPDRTQAWGDFTTFHNVKDNPLFNVGAFDFLGVKYLIVPRTFENYQKFFSGYGYQPVFETPWTITYENPNVFPRIFAVSTLIEKAGTPDQEGLGLRQVAFTQDKKLMEAAKGAGVEINHDTATIDINDDAVKLLSYHNASIKAKVELNHPAVIVLPDNWHPNWQARVDGKRVHVGKINESFRGIALPPGQHHLEMFYRPKTFMPALYVTCATLILLLSLVFFRKRIDDRFRKIIQF